MRYNIYCDEASTNGTRFMLIGGLWVPSDSEVGLRSAFQRVRERHNLTAEMKWTKVSRSLLPAYRDFVDVFVTDPSLSFRCIVIDTQIVDYSAYHHGDAELGFYKFYYQLISRNLKSDNQYWLYTDERQTRKANRLDVLRLTTNRWCKKSVGAEPLRVVEPRRSHDEDAIQLTDILLGAVASGWNRRTSSPAKKELAAYLARKLIVWPDFCLVATSRSAQRFNIWKWTPA